MSYGFMMVDVVGDIDDRFDYHCPINGFCSWQPSLIKSIVIIPNIYLISASYLYNDILTLRLCQEGKKSLWCIRFVQKETEPVIENIRNLYIIHSYYLFSNILFFVYSLWCWKTTYISIFMFLTTRNTLSWYGVPY